MEEASLTLINPQNGNLAFKLLYFTDGSYFDHVQRNNYYSLIWVREGEGKVKIDFAEYNFAPDHVFTFSLYQPFMFLATRITGVAIYFHPDFFCVYKHQNEVGCNGVLFNNIYYPPSTIIDKETSTSLQNIIDQMKTEVRTPAMAQYEILVSYLKIMLINLSRVKTLQQPETPCLVSESNEPFILQNLRDTIEKDYKIKHAPSEYAEALNISPKALAKITKGYFNKTLTELISERIIIEAKRELYLTSKSIKEIAFGLGYEDEYYFSRFFKTNTDVSPQLFRETIGSGRGEN